MPPRRNNGSDDDLVWKILTVVGWGILLVIAGVIVQAVYGWLVPRGSAPAPVPSNVTQRIETLEQSDREQDVAIRRLRWDVNKLYQRAGAVIGSDGRPVGNGGP